MKNSKILERVISRLPYSDQVTDIDLDYDKSIEFGWRGITYRVSENLCVEEVKDGMLMGSNSALLMEKLLQG